MLSGGRDFPRIDVGQSIEHPHTRHRIVFRRTAASTGGEAVVIEAHLGPGSRGLGPQAHPQQEVRIQVVHGTLAFRVGRRQISLGVGERLTVPAGVTHTYWNAGSEPAHFVAEIRPALDFEALLERHFRQEDR
ncbi:MAG TPA: cupin domain-containing protein [Gaiellaceae bacterium]|jgi:mannose-6-phosphate isomerase-like protein (cupin superfamily)|nr:cupin domain-containing protein [Gaiellaceae bacterium]